MVETLHASVTGRARFRVKRLYRCDPLRKHLEHNLAADPGVIRATASTRTSAILVLYNSGATQHRIGLLIEEAISEFNRSNGGCSYDSSGNGTRNERKPDDGCPEPDIQQCLDPAALPPGIG